MFESDNGSDRQEFACCTHWTQSSMPILDLSLSIIASLNRLSFLLPFDVDDKSQRIAPSTLLSGDISDSSYESIDELACLFSAVSTMNGLMSSESPSLNHISASVYG